MSNNQVWFITGTSSGFGKALAKELITQDYPVVATARNIESLSDLTGENLLKVELDVTKPESIKSAVTASIKRFKRIDVLVNNAGFGYFGTVEESEEEIVRNMMETNFWGASAVTRAVLPQMRAQHSGRIINVTSRGGLTTSPIFGYYHASKFAMEGLFQTLRQELAPLGIHVTNVEPGSFRTDWAGRSHFEANTAIKDYTTAYKSLEAVKKRNNHQVGNPKLAAKAFIKIAQLENPPLHYLMGKDAYQFATQVFKEALAEFETYKDDAEHLDFGDDSYWK